MFYIETHVCSKSEHKTFAMMPKKFLNVIYMLYNMYMLYIYVL